jgi:4-amino-4-deoxy-L-arabinose transferase-like glycosyltransferase
MKKLLEKYYYRCHQAIFAPSGGWFRAILVTFAGLLALLLLHYPLLRLPYFWDEAGYYIPAALDFYHFGRLVPSSTLPTGHTPLIVIYLALAWRAFGFSPLITRVAMIVIAAGTLTGVYALGRRAGNREIGFWVALLLAVSPLFFAQCALAHLDLAAGFFTLLALLAVLDAHPWGFAVASTCAVLSKETAVILLPVAGLFSWWELRRTGNFRARSWWIAYSVPFLALVAWEGFYHHATGFWTGSPDYLRYNLYSTLNPVRVLLTFLRRLSETFVEGFNWLLTAGAMAGIWWARRSSERCRSSERICVGARHGVPLPVFSTGYISRNRARSNSLRLRSLSAQHTAEPNVAMDRTKWNQLPPEILRRFFFLVGGLTAAYLLMLSVVGGAVLPRYLLPIFPPLVLVAVILIWRLPRRLARAIMGVTAICFVWAWFLNPPYPFPFEDNLAYADFVRIHERAAEFLEAQPSHPRILTAWPAFDELSRPFLGYVRRPLRVVAVESFARDQFDGVSPKSFDCLYLYSRRWEPPTNWLTRSAWVQGLQERYFQYQPQIPEQELVQKYHLRELASFTRRGQWAKIYVRQ